VSPRDFSRSFATWSLAHGIQRRALRAASRRGDLIARVTIDPVVTADPFAAYEELRARGRLVKSPVAAATVDHGVANQVLRSEHFGTAAGHAELPAPLRRLLDRVADPYSRSPVDPPSMLAVDPPDHTRYRKLVARAFTARRVGGMQDRVETVAESLLDRITDEHQGSFDVVETFAAQLPVAVIADLLGVPEREHGMLLDWGNQAAVTLDPGLGFRDYRTAEAALRRMHHWFDRHVARLRQEPGDDLLSQLILLEGDDRPNPTELRAIGLLVLGAGFETTVNLIGNAVVALGAHPDQLDLLRDEPERWGNAVEEVLRFDSPVQLTMRSAYQDAELGGVEVNAGQAVLVLLGGVNRDPEVFTDPHLFDISRPNAGEHLAFSAGVHFCVGASLARLEATVGLRALYARFPDLRVSGAPVRRSTRVLRGYERVPVSRGIRVAA
jgi:cytochrome P450